MHPPEPVRREDFDLEAMQEAGYRPGVVHGGIVYTINDRLKSLTYDAHSSDFHAVVARYPHPRGLRRAFAPGAQVIA